MYGEDEYDIEDYRHHGVRPRSREMGILMLADALEGATRAVFSDEEPTPERITSVVERVVGEKVSDGQLDLCALTLGDLSDVKDAFIDALVGHYHQRIPYPNFPGPDELESDGDQGLPAPDQDRAATDEIGSSSNDGATSSGDNEADPEGPSARAPVERRS